MQLGVTHPSRHHLLHEYQNCSFLKVAYIFLSVLFQQKDGKNFYHFLFYQTNHSHVQSNTGKALNHHSMQLGVTQSNHYHLLHEYKKSTPPRIFSLEFFRIFQNNYSNIFERLHLQNRKTITTAFPDNIRQISCTWWSTFLAKIKAKYTTTDFSKEFFIIFQNSYSNI